jgi:hypothetical protein
VQLTAAWVRRKRFEALLLAQALSFGGMARAAPKPSRDKFYEELLTSGAVRIEE